MQYNYNCKKLIYDVQNRGVSSIGEIVENSIHKPSNYDTEYSSSDLNPSIASEYRLYKELWYFQNMSSAFEKDNVSLS